MCQHSFAKAQFAVCIVWLKGNIPGIVWPGPFKHNAICVPFSSVLCVLFKILLRTNQSEAFFQIDKQVLFGYPSFCPHNKKLLSKHMSHNHLGKNMLQSEWLSFEVFIWKQRCAALIIEYRQRLWSLLI